MTYFSLTEAGENRGFIISRSRLISAEVEEFWLKKKEFASDISLTNIISVYVCIS